MFRRVGAQPAAKPPVVAGQSGVTTSTPASSNATTSGAAKGDVFAGSTTGTGAAAATPSVSDAIAPGKSNMVDNARVQVEKAQTDVDKYLAEAAAASAELKKAKASGKKGAINKWTLALKTATEAYAEAKNNFESAKQLEGVAIASELKLKGVELATMKNKLNMEFERRLRELKEKNKFSEEEVALQLGRTQLLFEGISDAVNLVTRETPWSTVVSPFNQNLDDLEDEIAEAADALGEYQIEDADDIAAEIAEAEKALNA